MTVNRIVHLVLYCLEELLCHFHSGVVVDTKGINLQHLTIEQFSNEELAELFSNQYFNEPLKYQAGLLRMMVMQGQMKAEDEQIMALRYAVKNKD